MKGILAKHKSISNKPVSNIPALGGRVAGVAAHLLKLFRTFLECNHPLAGTRGLKG